MIQDLVGYHWKPEFGPLSGYLLPLVTRIKVSRWLPVASGYHNFGLRLVTSYDWLSNLTI